MPLHKNTVRQKKFTISFSGTYARRTNATSYSVFGIVQDFVTAGTYINMGYAENALPLTFGGVSGGTERIDNSQGNVDRWKVNCMNNTDANHEYSAEEVRDSALACFQNNTWHNYASGEDFTPTQLGTWSTTNGATVTGETTYGIVWRPLASNTAAFADDHPATVFGISNHYIDIAELLVSASLNYNDNFRPTTAVFDGTNVTMTVGSTSLMATNKYWAVGREYGSADELETIPSWIGQVTSRSTSGSTTTIVLRITDGFNYLQSEVNNNSGGDTSILGLFQELVGSHQLVHRYGAELIILDQINNANLGYFAEGLWTEEDMYGPVQTGETSGVFNTLLLNSDSVNSAFGNDIIITGIPQNAVSSTFATLGTQIRILNFGSSSISVNTGSGIIFVRVDSAVNTTALQKYTVAAQLLSDYELNGVELDCRVSGTTDDPTITFIPRNTTITWTGASINTGGSEWTGTLSTGTITTYEPILLSLADDPNREGDVTGITFINNDWVEADDIQFFDFGRSSTGNLSKGFKWLFGKGYSGNFDGKDVTINGKDIELAFTYNERGNLWDAKTLTSGAQAVLATDENPFTLNLLDSSLTFSHINQDGGANLTSNERTFVIGSAGGFTRNNHIFNFENVIIGFYDLSTIAIAYSTLGFKKNVTEILNTTNGALLNAPSTLTPTLTGVRTVVDCDISLYRDSGNSIGTTSTQALARDFNSLLWRINAKLEGAGVLAGTKLTGYNPQSVNFGYINYLVGDKPYLGPTGTIGEIIHTWSSREAGGAGTMQYGVLHNPSYESEGEDGKLTNIFEEIYYGSKSDITLVPVKEGAERNAIGTIGANLHPFVSGVAISDTLGLADARINSAGVNNYSAGDGFIDATANYSGLVLIYARGVVNSTSPSTDPANAENNVTLYATQYFNRAKRAGHIYSSTSKGFSDNFDTLAPTVLLRKDKYWQADTVSDIDVYAAAIESSAHTVSTDSDFKCSLVNAGSWNDNWRKITYNQSTEQILGGKVGDEDRPYDSTNNINGRFLDLIDAENGVTSEGLMEVPRGPFSMNLEFNQTVSTDENSILGIDTGSQNQTYTHTGGTTKAFKGNLRTTGDIILATLNTNSSIAINDSEIYADDLRVTAVSGASHLPINNAKIEVNSLTFGGSYASQSENLSANYNIANSEIKVNGDNLFNHDLDNTTISGAHTRTITGEATDLTIIDAATVIMDTNSVDSRLGIISNKVATVTYSSTATPLDDIVHASGVVILPDNITSGVFNSDTSVTGVNAAVESTTPILTITDTLSGDSKVNNIGTTGTIGTLDGARLNLAAGSATTITSIADGQIVGADKTASVTTTTQILNGSFDTFTFGSMPNNTLSTRHLGDYTNCNFEMTLSGGVEFANASTGTGNVITKGPPNEIERTYYDLTSNYFKINVVNGVENSFEIKSEINEDVGGNPISLLKGTVGNRFYTVGNLVFREGIFQQDFVFSPTITERFYTLIEENKAENVVVRKGGIGDGITIAEENGANYTENVEFSKDPFVVNISSSVSGGMFGIKLPDGTNNFTDTSFDEVELSRGDYIKVAWIKTGYKMFYQSYLIEELLENGVQNIVISPVEELYPISESIRSGTEVNSVKFNQAPFASDNYLVVDVDYAIQKFKQMNKILVEAIMVNQETLKAMLHYESNDIFGSDGSDAVAYGNPDRFKVTSETAVDAATKETSSYIRPTTIVGSDTEAQAEDKVKMFVFLDLPLGIATEAPGGISSADVSGVLTEHNLGADNVKGIAEFEGELVNPVTT